jgi:hypothetical protein
MQHGQIVPHRRVELNPPTHAASLKISQHIARVPKYRRGMMACARHFHHAP